MKGLIVSLLSAITLMFSSCFGCNGCLLAMEACDGEVYADGICDMCGRDEGIEVSDSLEICTLCMNDYGELDGCGCY